VYYTYVLQSKVDGKFYTGFTKNLKLRFEQHNEQLVESTKSRVPLKYNGPQKLDHELRQISGIIA